MQIFEQPTSVAGKSFDSLAYAKRLETAGFTRQQAEVLAEEQSKVIDERLATKADIAALRGELKGDIAALRGELKGDTTALRGELKGDIAGVREDIAKLRIEVDLKIADLKTDIIKWVVGFGFAQAAMVIAAIKLHF